MDIKQLIREAEINLQIEDSEEALELAKTQALIAIAKCLAEMNDLTVLQP